MGAVLSKYLSHNMGAFSGENLTHNMGHFVVKVPCITYDGGLLQVKFFCTLF